MAKKKVLFLHDNVPAHSNEVAQEKLAELMFEILPHPAYSPDLAPSDFHLFPNLKKLLAGRRFRFSEEVIEAVDGYFEHLEKGHFLEENEKLEKRWTKVH
ncbi:hypothetical protein Y032_0479g2214 [Ancylostoma ceylanicum]|uniref:Tc1-like transposase DDE domain-containing protein n=1 Tax=Ancylostoma ceylanicum TaxID=53326 RepID=A0A016WW55_9BILA|nr:hypothetical protein Y032_0479g2214 [Ancylostoma ceylanicum]